MSHENRANQAIPQAIIDDVVAKLQSIQTALAPYSISLTDYERRTMGKMGDKTVAFVQKVADYVDTNSNFVPSYLDKTELHTDVKNAIVLEPILKLAEQVYNSISDTSMVCGSEAYMAALIYYNNVRQANKDGVDSARQIYDDLSQRFPGRSKKKAEPAL